MKLSKILPNHPDYCQDFNFIAGVDESGRGCGAGPIVTAAVILPKNFESNLLRDSKKLNDKQRQEAYDLIIKNCISFSCTASSVVTINNHGIDKAIFISFNKSLNELHIKPDHVLVDGNRWDDEGKIKFVNIVSLVVKGDDSYSCIAAASIIAKVKRDEYMITLSKQFTEYRWDKNKGYLTAEHITAISKIGVNKYHRKKFVRNFVK